MAYHADSEDLTGKEVLTWDTFGSAMRELAQTIVDTHFQPEVTIAIARGGLLPAGALTYALGTKLSDAMNIEFYTDIEKTLPDPVLLEPLLDMNSIKGKKLLVVDDVADSGRTLKLAVDMLTEFGADVRAAVIYHKPHSVFVPDYTWKETDKWIVFPWSAQPPVTPSK